VRDSVRIASTEADVSSHFENLYAYYNKRLSPLRPSSVRNKMESLCLACSSTIPARLYYSTDLFTTSCCQRHICPRCIREHPRLSTYQPCLACLAGVDVIASATEVNSKVLKIGDVEATEAFIIGDSDDEPAAEEEGGEPPAYAASSSTAGREVQESLPKEPGRHGCNTEYWIKPRDTLIGIALKYGVDGRLLCQLNALPPSTLTVTPHLLHTRTTLVMPPTARRPPTPPPADIQERLEKRAKEKAAKRLQFVTKETDPNIARTYISLGEGLDIGKAEEKSTKFSSQFDTLEGRAISQYLEDSEWEASQLRLGASATIRPFPYCPPPTTRSLRKTNFW